MSDLRITRTHSADEYQGALWGIEVVNFKWFALALLAGMGVFAGLFYGLALDFLAAGVWAVIPVVICVLYLRLGHQGKPPGFLADLLDSLITKGNACPPRRTHKELSPHD